MSCRADHDATKAGLASFFGATKLIGGQDDGEGGWLLLGTCVECNTTLGIPITEPRGRVMHGEIGAVPKAPHEGPPPEFFNDDRIT